MSADVDICNLALGMLGDDSNIASLTENSAQASYCSRLYPIARDMTLQMGKFGFTLRRIALASDLVSVPTSWQFAYSVPNNCLHKISVLPPGASDDLQSAPFAVESISDTGEEVIYTNVDTATLRYVQRVTDTSKYSPLVVNSIARCLASFLSGPILKGDRGFTVGLKHWKFFTEEALPKATGDDANSQSTDHFHDFLPAHLQARGGNNGNTRDVWPNSNIASWP